MSVVAVERPGIRSVWWKLLVAVLLVTATAAGMARLKFDNSTDAYFLKDDDTLLRYQRFRELFASDEYSLITLRTPPQVDATLVRNLQALEGELAKLEHVRRVRSIASARAIEGRGDELNVRGYLEDIPEQQLATRLQRATVHPYYRDLYISADGQSLGIVVETEIIKGEVDYKLELRKRIKAAIAASPLSKYSPASVGAPILDADVRDIVQRESSLFGALVFVIVGIGFALAFRSWVAVTIPLLVAALSVVATFGMMGWLGLPITLLTPIVPSFLISVGVGSSVFLLTEYFQRRVKSQLPAGQLVQQTVAQVRFPCTLACLTTSTALLSFSSSNIAPVTHIGIALGISLLIALALTFSLGTGLLQLFAPKVSPEQSSRLLHRAQWLARLDSVAARHRNKILVIATAVTLLAAIGVTQLQLDYYYLGTFKESTDIRRDYGTSDERLPRSAAIEVVLQGSKPDTFTDPQILQRMARLQANIDAFAGLPVKSYSIADIIKEINQALNENVAGSYRIPDSSAAVSQSLLLFESSGNDEMTNLVTPDYSAARISVLLPTVPESRSAPLRQFIDEQLQQTFQGSDVSYSVTGLVPMWMRINDYLRSTQINSVLLAFAISTLVLMFYSRSLSTGLMLSFVNASVVVIVLGLMALCGWPLDPYTVLIANIALGVLDDDTMHFFTDIRQRLAHGVDLDTAISAARGATGQAMYYYALSLIVGFLVYVFSSVRSLSIFGTLVAVMIALGLVWEWLVMPAYLSVLHRYRLIR